MEETDNSGWQILTEAERESNDAHASEGCQPHALAISPTNPCRKREGLHDESISHRERNDIVGASVTWNGSNVSSGIFATCQ